MSDTLTVPSEGPFSLTVMSPDFTLVPPTELATDAIQLQVVQQGPPGTPGAAAAAQTAPAGQVLRQGAPVRIDNLGQLLNADAANVNNAFVIGLVGTAVASGFATEIIRDVMIMSNWVLITGTGSLTPGSLYFLSTTAGRLTTTPPTSVGQSVAVVGRAISATTLELSLEPPIAL